MILTFWLSFAAVAYAYFGYALVLWIMARLCPRPILHGQPEKMVSVIIAARNEEARLQAKIDNLKQVNYPREKLQIIIASDGSSDTTIDILHRNSETVVPAVLETSRGKACALNEAVQYATGNVLVFLDVRQTLHPEAIRELVSCFEDPSVGAVSGELLLDSATPETSSDGLGIYWKLEKAVRRLESASGSVVGVTGAIYAILRELYEELPPGTILDDVLVPMRVARVGKRVLFQPTAIAYDRIFAAPGKEFSRKIRTLTGNYQLLSLAPWLLSLRNPLLFRFISHKLLRLAVPLLLALMLLAASVAGGTFYRTLFWLQIVFYGMALLGALSPATKRFRPVAIANTFVMLNAAAALAFWNFIGGKQDVWAS